MRKKIKNSSGALWHTGRIMPRGIGKKLYMVIVLFGCVLFILVGVILSEFIKSGLRKDFLAVQSNQTKQFTNVLKMYIENLIATVNNVSEFDKVKLLYKGQYSEYDAFLIYRDIYRYIDNIKEYDRWKDIYIFPSRNRNLLSTDKRVITSDYTKYGVSVEELFKDVADLQVVPSFSLGRGATHMMAAIRRVRDINSMDIIGNTVVTMDDSVMSDILSGTNWSANDLLVISDDEGRLIYRSNADRLASLKLEATDITDIISKGEDGFVRGGARYSIFVTRLEHVGWNVITISDEAVLARDLIKTQLILFAVILLLILLLLFFAKRVVGMFTKPITKLTDLMLDAEKNNYNKMLNIESDDETKILAISFNKMMYDIRENQILLKQSQIDALQKQINPHFLFNTLESIKVLSYSHDYDGVAMMIQRLSDMFRYNMNRENQKVTYLQDELLHMKNYLDIQLVRFSDRLMVEYNIDEPILKQRILKFVLQPIVENAIVHGLEHSEKGFIIKVDGGFIDNHVVITISDNGRGIPPDMLGELNEVLKNPIGGKDHFGIGLKNISERIKLYYGSSYYLKVESEPLVGTKVVLRIPCVQG